MKRLLYPLYILLVMIILIPKENIYHSIESELEKYHIYFSDEILNNRLLYLDVEDIQVILENMEVGSIERMRISPWVVYNQIRITSLTLSPECKLFLPGTVDEVDAVYSIFHPLSIRIRGKGDFGECSGTIDLVHQKLRIVFDASAQLRHYPVLIAKLHQEEGGLVYESNF